MLLQPLGLVFTGTLDPQKYDRTNLDKFHKDLTQWLRDYGKQHKVKIKFLLVPEQHSDGISWHIHGFLHGLPEEHLKQFVVGDVMGKGLAEKSKEAMWFTTGCPILKNLGSATLNR